MDDLIILLIKAIAKWLGGQPPRQPGAPAAKPNLPPAWHEQVRNAVAAAKRPAKGQARGRRPSPPPGPAAPPVTIVRQAPAPPPPAPPPLLRQTPPPPPAPATHASPRRAPAAARADLRHWLTPSVLQ